MTDTVAYDKLFHSDHWFTNDGLAVEQVNFENVKFADAYLNVASPVRRHGLGLAKASFDAEKDVVACLGTHRTFQQIDCSAVCPVRIQLDTEVSKATVNLKANYLIAAAAPQRQV